MKDKIAKAIEESLPKQVGEALQKRLKDLEETEKAFDMLNKAHIKQTRLLQDKKDELQEVKALKYEAELVVKERATLTKDQLEFSVEKQLKEQKITSGNEKVALMNNLVGLLMKNPQAITSMTGNQMHLYNDEYISAENRYQRVRTNTMVDTQTSTELKKPDGDA